MSGTENAFGTAGGSTGGDTNGAGPQHEAPETADGLLVLLEEKGYESLGTLVPLYVDGRALDLMEWAGLLLRAMPQTRQGRERGDDFRHDIALLAAPGQKQGDTLRAMERAAKAYDAEVKAAVAKAEAEAEANKVASLLPELEPWPSPVDGVELLDAIKAAAIRHLGLPTRGGETIALWVLFSHTLDAFSHSPRLAFVSPAPECGKTTALKLLYQLVPRPLGVANTTAAAIFRTTEKWNPTWLFDEAETFMKQNEEMRGVTNTGHDRALAFVIRLVGDTYDPKRFGVWCPMVLAQIGKLEPTTESRSIVLEMRRLGAGEKVEPLPTAPLYSDLARKAARWGADNLEALRGAEPVLPEGFANRHSDNWRPLLAVADLAGGDWPALARDAAVTLSPAGGGQTIPILLLSDLRDLFAERQVDRLLSADITEALAALEGRPWAEFGRAEKRITANALARLLKNFGIVPETLRVGGIQGDRGKGYRLSAFDDAFTRYLPPLQP